MLKHLSHDFSGKPLQTEDPPKDRQNSLKGFGCGYRLNDRRGFALHKRGSDVGLGWLRREKGVAERNIWIDAGMKWLLGTYTSRFNRRHRLSGHLFNERYKALVVDGSGNGYLRTACDYAHLNPVRAGLLQPEQSLREYRWSSYGEYLSLARRRAKGMRVDRLFGEMRIPKDSPADAGNLKGKWKIAGSWMRGQNSRRCGAAVLGDEEFRRELLTPSE